MEPLSTCDCNKWFLWTLISLTNALKVFSELSLSSVPGMILAVHVQATDWLTEIQIIPANTYSIPATAEKMDSGARIGPSLTKLAFCQ